MSEKTTSNNTLFYNALIQGLLRPEASYTDSHYLGVTPPPDGAFVGGGGWISDYLDYMLKAAQELATQRQQVWATAFKAGKQEPFSQDLTQADRKAFLERGLGIVDVELRVGSDQEQYSCAVARPQDLPEDNYILEAAVSNGLEPVAEEPFVYDSIRKLYIPDPFEEPHLLAVYRYLTAEA